jgi:hypothetical protein
LQIRATVLDLGPLESAEVAEQAGQTDQDQIDRDDVVKQPRKDQDQDTGDQRDERLQPE